MPGSEYHNPNESTTVNNLDARGNVDVGGSLTLGSMVSSGVNSVTATSSGAALSTDLVQLVTSANDAHKVKLPASTKAGQIIIVVSIGAKDVIVENQASSPGTVVTVGEQSSAILVSTGASTKAEKWNTA